MSNSNRNIEISFPAIFSPEGCYTTIDGKIHDIDDMDAQFKRNAINHLMKALKLMKYRGSLIHGKTFSGDYAEHVAKKLEELGVEVTKNKDNSYTVYE